MKKFKELGMAFIAFIACISMAACSSETDAPVTDEEQDVYTVQLGMGGELDVTYEPLSRATTDDLYGIQVYSTPNKELAEGEKVEWTKFAYGLFDNADEISINLLKGYKYKFVATMVKDGQNKLRYAIANDKKTFYGPFNLTGTTSNSTAVNNSFDYQSSIFMNGLSSGSSYLLDAIYKRPNLDRFYGELEDFVPGRKNTTANIKMKRTSFGAKFIAINSIAKTGVLEVQITGAPKMELDFTAFQIDNPAISDVFTFSDVDGAYADNNFSETIDVTINWHKVDGTIFPLGTHQITYKRNKMTVVTVKIIHDTSSNNLGLEITETGEIEGDGENDKTIEDGEVVDTEVNAQGTNSGSN